MASLASWTPAGACGCRHCLSCERCAQSGGPRVFAEPGAGGWWPASCPSPNFYFLLGAHRLNYQLTHPPRGTDPPLWRATDFPSSSVLLCLRGHAPLWVRVPTSLTNIRPEESTIEYTGCVLVALPQSHRRGDSTACGGDGPPAPFSTTGAAASGRASMALSEGPSGAAFLPNSNSTLSLMCTTVGDDSPLPPCTLRGSASSACSSLDCSVLGQPSIKRSRSAAALAAGGGGGGSGSGGKQAQPYLPITVQWQQRQPLQHAQHQLSWQGLVPGRRRCQPEVGRRALLPPFPHVHRCRPLPPPPRQQTHSQQHRQLFHQWGPGHIALDVKALQGLGPSSTGGSTHRDARPCWDLGGLQLTAGAKRKIMVF